MKSAPLITALVATAFVAACGSTTFHPTGRPATPTVSPETTPTASPISTPAVTVSTTCSNVPANWGYPGGLPSGALLATVVWHGVEVGDYVDLGNEPPLAQITSNPFSLM